MSDVVVIGGGHAGLLLAHGLAGAGIRVTVVDAAPPDPPATPFEGRALALMYGSRRVFEKLGAWDAVRGRAMPVEGVRVLDVASGARASYDARDVADHPFAYGVLNHQLRASLLDLVRSRSDICVLAPDQPRRVRPSGSGVAVELESGRRLHAALVVGADGRMSGVRTLMRIRTESWSYDRTALTFAVRHETPHEGLVREFLRPGGPLALLPVGPRLTSITWVERPDVARWLSAVDEETLLDRLEREIGPVLGPMQLEGQVTSWPLGGHCTLRPVAPRVALVGDAAHGLHPIHAQGFNLGVRDIAVLVELVAAARDAGRDVGGSDLLLDYARRRRNDTRLMVGLTDGLARLFSTDFGPLSLARGLALTLIDGLPPLKAIAMRRGMGLQA